MYGPHVQNRCLILAFVFSYLVYLYPHDNWIHFNQWKLIYVINGTISFGYLKLPGGYLWIQGLLLTVFSGRINNRKLGSWQFFEKQELDVALWSIVKCIYDRKCMYMLILIGCFYLCCQESCRAGLVRSKLWNSFLKKLWKNIWSAECLYKLVLLAIKTNLFFTYAVIEFVFAVWNHILAFLLWKETPVFEICLVKSIGSNDIYYKLYYSF